MANGGISADMASEDDTLPCITTDCGAYWFSVVPCHRRTRPRRNQDTLIMEDGVDIHESIFWTTPLGSFSASFKLAVDTGIGC